MKAIKKIGVLSSVFLMATLTAVFSPAASAADHLVTDAGSFTTAVSSAAAGDTITIQSGSTVTLPAGAINLAGVSIILQGGSTLTGSATLNFSGSLFAPIQVFSTAAPPVTISGLTINDQSTSTEPLMGTIWETSSAPQGNTTVTGCTFTGGTNVYAIYTAAGNNAVITNNKFISYVVPVYIDGNNASTLTLTGNTFVNSGTSVIDYVFLKPGAGSTIANNIFDSSDTLPAFTFVNSASGGAYTPTEADLLAVIAANPAYPIVVDDYSGLATTSGTEVYYPGGTSTATVVTATFQDSNGSTLTSGSVSATTITMDVTPATTLTSAQFPTVNTPKAGYNLVWTRSDGLGLTAAIGQDVTFTATWVLKASPTSIPATGSLTLAVLGLLLAGLAVVRLRFMGL